MVATTGVVQHTTVGDAFRRHGFFFREAAMLTISLGLVMHVLRVTLGDAVTLQHVMTPTTDKVLLIPMTYAGVAGVLIWHRVAFVNTAHKVFFTWSLAYIALSVPLHVYFGVLVGDVDFYFTFFPVWFSYLLFAFYAALLTMLMRLRYQD